MSYLYDVDCPFCQHGFSNEEIEEELGYDVSSYEVEFDCTNCDRTFELTVDYSVTFTVKTPVEHVHTNGVTEVEDG